MGCPQHAHRQVPSAPRGTVEAPSEGRFQRIRLRLLFLAVRKKQFPPRAEDCGSFWSFADCFWPTMRGIATLAPRLGRFGPERKRVSLSTFPKRRTTRPSCRFAQFHQPTSLRTIDNFHVHCHLLAQADIRRRVDDFKNSVQVDPADKAKVNWKTVGEPTPHQLWCALTVTPRRVRCRPQGLA